MYDTLALKTPKDVLFNSNLPNTITTYDYGSIRNSSYASYIFGVVFNNDLRAGYCWYLRATPARHHLRGLIWWWFWWGGWGGPKIIIENQIVAILD